LDELGATSSCCEQLVHVKPKKSWDRTILPGFVWVLPWINHDRQEIEVVTQSQTPDGCPLQKLDKNYHRLHGQSNAPISPMSC
jgi:hypothetical protein